MLEALGINLNELQFDSLVFVRRICLPPFRKKMLVTHIDCN